MKILAADPRSIYPNISAQNELDKNRVCAKFAHTAADGKTYQVAHYSLDAIISVGYRVKSKRGTQFRIWATSVLKDHLVNGFTFNQNRLAEKGLGEMRQMLSLRPTPWNVIIWSKKEVKSALASCSTNIVA